MVSPDGFEPPDLFRVREALSRAELQGHLLTLVKQPTVAYRYGT
jgi:hypothetical protein